MNPHCRPILLLTVGWLCFGCGGTQSTDQSLQEGSAESSRDETAPEPAAELETPAATTEDAAETAADDASATETDGQGRPDVGSGWLGIALSLVDEKEGIELGLDGPAVRVTTVFPNSPAAASNFSEGDLVLRIDDHRLVDSQDLVTRVGASPPGTLVDFTVVRDGETVIQPVMLGLRPEFDDLMVSLFVDQQAPPVLANRLADDGPVDLAEHDLVVLDFWATWCGPCRRALPAMSDMQESYRDRGVEFIALSAEAPEILQGFVDENPMSVTVAYDLNEETTHNYFITAYPTVFIIDAEGVVRDVFIGGGEGEIDDIDRRVQELLDERGVMSDARSLIYDPAR